ncbi:MAG: RHS repeat-associated core domain-containing protein, partial [candidate division WOR-3 bacterium]
YDADIQGAELYNLRARYYDPKVGRFISEDPEIGFIYAPQQRNLYPYVWNMPINLTDPLGLFTGCKVITKYPIHTQKDLLSEEEKTLWWEFRRFYTTGYNQFFPVPFFWVHCEWSQVVEITRIYRELTIWSYVLKCWEKCSPPVIKAYDVVVLGPLSTEISTRLRESEKILGPYNIVSESPAFKLKWEIECSKAGPP